MPISTQKKNNPPIDKNLLEKDYVEKILGNLKNLDGEHSIAVGLSGGVDSSLSAALLVEAGWKVEGLTLWLMSGKGSCCTDGLVDAAGICEQLDIPHHVLDTRSVFEAEIIETLVNGYKVGITPLPCSRCNKTVKFERMLTWAKGKKDINFIASGHYARIEYAKKNKPNELKDNSNRHKLLRGIDKNKDQSYFLYDLPQEILGNLIFPLGELTKEETRNAAKRYKLRTAEKPESQDLCLVEHHGSMKKFLDNYLPTKEGEIVLKDGPVLGKHDGIEHFTIGQRKGLGISWKEPLHVIDIQSSSDRVIVAPRAEAGRANCVVGEVNWLSIAPPDEPLKIEVQLRYRSNPIIATIIPIEPTHQDISNERPYRCILNFEDKQFSVTPGQAAVFYSNEIVLGGGLIQPF